MIGVIEVPHNYAIVIFYSGEEEGFIAVVPEVPGCSALGETEEEALSEVKVAIGLWLDPARGRDGRSRSRAVGSICGRFLQGRALPGSRWRDIGNYPHF